MQVWALGWIALLACGQQVVVQPGAPGTPSRRLPPNTAAVAPIISAADVAFMQGMVMHHGQAVAMTALIPSHTTNEAVRRLGARISLSQSDEIRFMKRWLVARGAPASVSMPGMPGMHTSGDPKSTMPEMPGMHTSGDPKSTMPGMLTDAQMTALRGARGAAFDHAFLTGMIQHHTGALTMVKQLFATPGAGQDAELFDFATDVDNTQRAEIQIMKDMLKEHQ